MLVRIENRFTGGTDQPQTHIDRASSLLTVLRERNALDILHDEVGIATWGSVAIIEPCDERVSELCQSALLNGEALAAARRHPGIAKHFDCNLASEVLALSQVNDAHSAFAEYPQQPIGAGFFEG